MKRMVSWKNVAAVALVSLGVTIYCLEQNICKKNKVKTSKHRGGRMSKFECRQKGCFRLCCPEKGNCPYRCTSQGCHRRCP